MSYYTYSISDDLGGNYDSLVLYDTINGTIFATESDPICIGLKNVDSNANVEVHFTAALNGAQQTTLDGIISGYSYESPFKKIKYYSFQLNKFETDSANYDVIGTITYPGTNNTGQIFEFEFIGYLQNGATSYDIQVVDKTTNTMIANSNFTNTNSGRMSITDILYCPTEVSTLELSVKVNKNGNSSKNVYLTEFIFWVG